MQQTNAERHYPVTAWSSPVSPEICRRLTYAGAVPAPADPQVTHLRVEALGVVVPLEVRGADLAEAVAQAWQDALVDDPGTTPPLVVAVGPWGAAEVAGADVAEVLHRLSPAVTQRAIDARAGQLVMLHAAALADPATGATALLVAPSGTGKTTASATLGTRFAYLTDETAGVEPDGTLAPHRKPLSLIRGGHLKDQVSPTALGLLGTDRACHVAALLVIERDPDHAGDPVVSDLDTIDALALLAPQASFLGRLERPLQRLVDVVRRAGGARHVTYAEAATLEPVVRALLDGGRR